MGNSGQWGRQGLDGGPLQLIVLLFAVTPILEIAAFILVGSEIGVLRTLGLVGLSMLAGMVLLRVQGLGAMNRIRSELQAGRNPGRQLAHGAMIVLAGILLIVPGFVTDAIGLLLFLPPVRNLAWRFFRRRVAVAGTFAKRPAASGGRTIDLDKEEFRRTGKSPWRIGSDD